MFKAPLCMPCLAPSFFKARMPMTGNARRARSAHWITRLCCGVFGLLAGAGLLAQSLHLVGTRLPTPVEGDGNSGDNFGFAVAASGNYAVVGALGDTVVAPDAQFGISQGSAYVFERDGSNWLITQKLTPDAIGQDGDNFGASVSMADDYLAIGAPRRGQDGLFESGTVFIYGRSAEGYLLRQILSPPTPSAEQRFGTAIALWQDQLAIGAPAAGNGRVDLYRRDGVGSYVFQRSVFPEAGATGARFGESVAMADGQLLIGAPAAGGGTIYQSAFTMSGWSDAVGLALSVTGAMELGAALSIADGVALAGAPGVAAGEVRVLTLTAGIWSQTSVLTASDGAAGDRFGSALTLDAGRAAIGAVAATFSEGKTYLYSRSGSVLSEVDVLDIADGGTANRFGTSLAVAAGGVLIGADLDRVGPNSAQGSVRWFEPGSSGYIQVALLDSGNGAIYDRYGSAVATDGEFALIGAYLEDTFAGADAGAAHWFRRAGDQWIYGGQLLAPDGEIEDRFGIAVDVDAGRMAVGAFWDVVGGEINQGSVYIYRREGADWVFESKLVASDGNEGDLFGFALSLDGDRILVGARGASFPTLDQGAAYVFARGTSGWAEEAKLEIPGLRPQAYFGASVALSGDRALVGAPGVALGDGTDAVGAALVFQRRGENWLLGTTLQAPRPQVNAAYGFAVAADPVRLLVGAFQDGIFGTGAAYVYRADDLSLEGELRSAQGQPGEGLGIAVALEGSAAVLGGTGYDLSGQQGVGIVRVFTHDGSGWQEDQQWFAADAAAGDGFGRALALGGGRVVVGAPGKAIADPLEGMAYVDNINLLFADGFD